MRNRRLAEMLGGGDRRSIGKSNQIAKLVLSEPTRFAELIECLWDEAAVVRMRAADAAEKVSAVKPELLKAHKQELLGLLAEAEQIELRWHLALMVPRLALSGPERQRAAAGLQRYLEDRSSIVRTFALQGIADLAKQGYEPAGNGEASYRREPANGHCGDEGSRKEIVERAERLRAVRESQIH